MSAARVLVTRPRPAGERTAGRIAELGMTPVVLPVTGIVTRAESLGAISGRAWAAVVFTSANAVSAVGDEPGVPRGLPVYAVGRRTAQTARQAGFTAVRAGGGDGLSLAAAIRDDVVRGRLGVSEARPLLYLAGRPRSPGFEDALRVVGLPFVTVECYETQSISYAVEALKAVLAKPFDFALFYSCGTAHAFFRLLAEAGLTDQFRARRIVCLSEKVATALPDGLCDNAIIAESPSEKAVLELLAAMRE